jgi:hypothetical protein
LFSKTIIFSAMWQLISNAERGIRFIPKKITGCAGGPPAYSLVGRRALPGSFRWNKRPPVEKERLDCAWKGGGISGLGNFSAHSQVEPLVGES